MFKKLLPLALAATALPAAADAPVYFFLPNDHKVYDVTAYQGDVIAVGVEWSGNTCFRWRMSTNAIEYLGGTSSAPQFVHVSDDGTQVCGTIVGVDTKSHIARWTGTNWVQVPDLGGFLDSTASTGFAISGDGLTYAGTSYPSGVSTTHAMSWTQAGGTVDHGGAFGDPHSMLFGANLDGTVLVGRKESSGAWQGSRWVNGVRTGFTHVIGPLSYRLGDALAVNSAGTVIAGTKCLGVSSANLAKAWRWDSAGNVTTLLDNLAGDGSTPRAIDVSDDGTLILGQNGQSVLGDPQGVIWVNNVTWRLDDWLGSQGAAPPSDLEMPIAMSREGAAFGGYGAGIGSITDPWIVVFPEKLEIGTPYCSGDGSGTLCPCSPAPVPHGAAAHGCPNSLFPAGGKLRATGIPSVATDNVVLRGSNLPNGPCLYFQGTTQQSAGLGSTFGDGLRCAAGSVRRFAVQTSVGNASKYPNVGNNPISIAGLIPGTGGTRTYQNWYRNGNPTFCTPFTFNLTNGIELVWTP